MIYKVLLSDPDNVTLDNIAMWLYDNNIQYTFDIVDVSDVSYEYDTVAQFNFTNQEDLLLFTLKWK